MAHFLVVCATHRDRRELPRLAASHAFTWHEYATDALEDLVSPVPHEGCPVSDPCVEVERLVGLARSIGVDAVVSTDDYPGSALAAIVGDRLRLPCTPPGANLLCQHKYLSRVAQRAIVPEVVPEFILVDDCEAVPLALPYVVKPVKSFFSVGVVTVRNDADRRRATGAQLPAAFFDVFNRLLQAHGSHTPPSAAVIAEALVTGFQVTVEGYAFHGEVEVLGIVDSIMYADTVAFRRFEYPSHLPAAVQDRMTAVTIRLMRGLGYTHGFFNVEMIYNRESGTLFVIEVNPRMSSQFADLFEKVDGINSYEILLDLALGRAPRVARRAGRHPAAASCVLRRFDDAWVTRIPTAGDIARVLARFPDARVEILADEGRRLSEQMQDSCSYRFGLVNLGGRDRRDIVDRFAECRRLLPFGFRECRTGRADRRKTQAHPVSIG
jgi:biotin carboxylase